MAVSETAVQAWARLLRLQQRLLEKVGRDLKAAGLPPLEWYDVLLELDRAPGGRLRHGEIYPKLLIAKYNLSRLIDRMAADGLVRREPVSGDGRGATIAITPDGRALRQRMWPVYEAAIERHFAGRMNSREIGDLHRILGGLLADDAAQP